MKNLFLFSAEGNKNFLYQHNGPDLQADTMERVEELQRRKTLDKSEREQLLLKVDVKGTESMNAFSQQINAAGGTFDNKNIQKLAKLSVSSEEGEFGKLYRTEMVARMVQFLLEQDKSVISKTDASKILEQSMASFSYETGTATQALFDAMRMVSHDKNSAHKLPDALVKKFSNKRKREALAAQMESDGVDGIQLGEKFTFGETEYSIKECEILTGGAMTKIDAKLLSQFKIKNAIKIDNQILAQMENGCEGNFVVIDVEEVIEDDDDDDDDDNEIIEDDDDDDELLEEVEPVNIELVIGEILPEYGQYIYLNPRTHWFDYSDAYFKLPVGRQREIKTEIEIVLNEKMQESIQKGLDAQIEAEPDPKKKSVLEAVKLLQNGEENLVEAREKLIASGEEGKEIFDNMNHDLERVRQGQLLAMFEATEGSKHEATTDDWAIKKWFSKDDEKSQERMDLIHKVSPVVQEVFMNYTQDVATIEEAVLYMTQNPSIKPGSISDQELEQFNDYWNEFLNNEGKITASVDINDAAFMEKMANANQKQWLEIAKQMREEGQYEQAENILRSIILGHVESDGKTGKELMEEKLDEETKNEIEADIRRSIREDLILENLENQGLLTDDGLEGAGLYDSASGEYYDPMGNIISRSRAVNILVEHTKDTTIANLVEKDLLFEAAGEDVFEKLNLNDTEKEAFDVYKDMEGVGAWNFADSTRKMIIQEIGLSVAILALSATGVGLIGVGARVGSLLARAGRIGNLAGKVGRLSASTNRYARFAGKGLQTTGRLGVKALPMAVDGAVFHNIHSAISTPVVGTDAWNEYWTGMGHSIGMYMIFGAGNQLWNKGMKGLETKFAGSAVGKTAGRAQVESVMKAYQKGGFKEMGRVLVAKQPAMALEALAMTGAIHTFDGGLEDGNFLENFAKNWVTFNLLWMSPKIAKPKPKPDLIIDPVIAPTKHYRNKNNTSKDKGLTNRGENAAGENGPGFGQHHGKGKGAEQGARNEHNLVVKNEKAKMVKKAKKNKDARLERAEAGKRNVGKLQTEIMKNMKSAEKASKKMTPKEAKKHIKDSWNKESQKLETQEQYLKEIGRQRKLTKEEQASLNKLKTAKAELYVIYYDQAIVRVDVRAKKAKEKYDANKKKEAELQREIEKAQNIPKKGTFKEFETLMGKKIEGEVLTFKAKVTKKDGTISKDPILFEIKKVTIKDGELASMKARVSKGMSYNFTIKKGPNGEIGLTAPNKGGQLEWKISVFESVS
jgi:hypothetical protein